MLKKEENISLNRVKIQVFPATQKIMSVYKYTQSVMNLQLIDAGFQNNLFPTQNKNIKLINSVFFVFLRN